MGGPSDLAPEASPKNPPQMSLVPPPWSNFVQGVKMPPIAGRSTGEYIAKAPGQGEGTKILIFGQKSSFFFIFLEKNNEK